MKNKLTAVIALIFILQNSPAFASQLQADTVTKNKPGSLQVITLTGTSYQRGYTHGKILKKEIAAVIARWNEKLKKEELFQGKNLDQLIADFMKKTRFYEAAKKWTPDIIDEVKGIADGSGIDPNTIMLFQVFEEFETFSHHILGLVDRCTSIGIRASTNQNAFVAQNMDIPTYLHGSPVLLHIRDEAAGIESYVYTIPGLVGVCGLNSKAVAITCNSLTQLQFSREGLPVAFIVRGVLTRKSYLEAEKFLKTITHATGQNYIIGGPGYIESFECSVNTVVNYRPNKFKQLVFHTNHPVVNKNYLPSFLRGLRESNLTLLIYNSICKRFGSLSQQFKTGDRHLSMADIKILLSNRDDHINNSNTYGTLIMQLSPVPRLHLAPGRPDKTEFRIFNFGKNGH